MKSILPNGKKNTKIRLKGKKPKHQSCILTFLSVPLFPEKRGFSKFEKTQKQKKHHKNPPKSCLHTLTAAP